MDEHDANTNGNGNGHAGNGGQLPPKESLPSAAVPSKEGAPVEPSKLEVSAGVPVEPLTPNQREFLKAFAECAGNASAAALLCGMSRRTHHRWISQSPLYAEEAAEIHEQAADEVDAEIRRRGVQGVDEPVYYQGDIVGTIRKYSDLLLIFRAKALRPEVYRERHEVTGANGQPLNPSKVEHVVKYDFSGLDHDEINDLYSKLRRSRVLPSTGN